MTTRTIVECDSCGDRIANGELYVQFIVDDGVYSDVHVRCVNKVLSLYMTGEANAEKRLNLESILLHGVSRTCSS